MKECTDNGAKVVVFPELCITGYTCQDLFWQDKLIAAAEDELIGIADYSRSLDGIFFIGLPYEINGMLYNMAAVVSRGEVLAMVPKTFLPNYNEFYEARHFASGENLSTYVTLKNGQQVSVDTDFIFSCKQLPKLKIAVELCEDLWTPNPPSIRHAMSGATVIVNLSASDEVTGKAIYRRELVSGQSARLICGYIYASAGDGESTQDVVYSGHNLICENGNVLAESKRFTNETIYSEFDVERIETERRRMTTFVVEDDHRWAEFDLEVKDTILSRYVNPAPFVPADKTDRDRRCDEILMIQAMGLKKRLEHTNCKTGKIKVRKVEDNTAAEVEILVHLTPGVSSDKALDALYAFTDCEVSISPNCCVIDDKKPCFLTVSEVLKRSVDNTLGLLRKELLIRKGELQESLHFASLEKIFIEERIYKDRNFEQAKDMDAACAHIDERLTPFYPQMIREVTQDDILKLMDIKMARILKFNKDKANDAIARMKDEIARIDRDLDNMVEVTCNWFRMLKAKYGDEHPRHTELRNFDTIVATKVVEANEKLYINREEGFIGTSLKKDEFIANCSDLDDAIIFYRDGTYKVIRISDKTFVGETERSKAEKKKAEIIHAAVFKRNDKRTIYNVAYRDGKDGFYYIKRFNVTSITRDREYDLTQGKPFSRVVYFTANPNGEAEVIKITLKPALKLKKIFVEKDFSTVTIKGRQSMGNILSKNEIQRIGLKSHGGSTLGGRKVWFDHDVNRLNYDERGEYLGEFHSEDLILVILKSGEFYTTNFDVNNHYEPSILRIEKFSPDKIWCAVLYDADQQGYPYVKRFAFEPSTKPQSFMGENKDSRFVLLTDEAYPRLQITFGGHDSFRDPQEIDAESFIGVKSFKAKGKRLTTFDTETITELEPIRRPEPETEEAVAGETEEKDTEKENLDPDAGKSQSDIVDELTGQMKLFEDE